MGSTTDIRNGLCIQYNHDVYQIVEFQHVKPGKGPAFVRTKLKSLTMGKVVDNTFPSGHKIEIVRIERRTYQFSYKEDGLYYFMDTNTYEMVPINGAMLENADLMKDGQEMDILYDADKEIPLTAELPGSVELLVTYSEPGVKGDTATNVTKPATVETGAEIAVPLFVNEGDVIKVDTKTRSYMERVKK